MKPLIPIDVLHSVQLIVCHQNGPSAPCPDGTASAVLLHDVLPHAQVRFVHHEVLDTIEPQWNVLFCDIAPPADSPFQKFNPIVLDHHVKQRDVVKSYQLGVYPDDEPGTSGAMLAFSQVWLPLREYRGEGQESARARLFAAYASIRDTWQRNHPWWSMACDQAEALRFFSWDDLCNMRSGGTFFENPEFVDRLAIGSLLRKKHLERVESQSNNVVYVRTEHFRIGIVNTLDTSDLHELVSDKCDVLVGFGFFDGQDVSVDRLVAEGRPMRLSFRSSKFDVGEVAKKLGGGGHRNAAGCGLILKGSPYTAIVEAIELELRFQAMPF